VRIAAEVNAEGSGGPKEYDIQPRALVGVLSPVNLAAVAAKGVALHMAPLVERYCSEVEHWAHRREQHELVGSPPAELEPLPPLPDAKPALRRASTSAGKDVTVQLFRRLLERAFAASLRARNAWKLLKDAPSSCHRKAQRSLPSSRFSRALRAGRCAARAHSLTALAELIFVLVTSSVWPSPRSAAHSHSRAHSILRSLSRASVHLALSVACAALLCALVALAFPRRPAAAQWGTALSLLVSDEAANLLQRLAARHLQRRLRRRQEQRQDVDDDDEEEEEQQQQTDSDNRSDMHQQFGAR